MDKLIIFRHMCISKDEKDTHDCVLNEHDFSCLGMSEADHTAGTLKSYSLCLPAASRGHLKAVNVGFAHIA